MKTYGMNDAVYYKLTPKGKEIWEKWEKEFSKMLPNVKLNCHVTYYYKDWVKDQLWCCFERFGKHTGLGKEAAVYDITFDDPLKEAK